MNKFIFALICCAFEAFAQAPKDSRSVRYDACYNAHHHIEAWLKAPATAEFPNCYRHDDLVNTQPIEGAPGAYLVTTYVDAQNSFGAKIRSYFGCPVIFTDEKHVKVQCVETDSSHTKTLSVF